MDKQIMDMTFAEVLEKSKELIETLKVEIEAMDQQVSEAYQQRVIAEETYVASDYTIETCKVFDDAEDKYWELQNKLDDLNYKLDSLERMVYKFRTINGIMDLADLADHLAV